MANISGTAVQENTSGDIGLEKNNCSERDFQDVDIDLSDSYVDKSDTHPTEPQATKLNTENCSYNRKAMSMKTSDEDWKKTNEEDNSHDEKPVAISGSPSKDSDKENAEELSPQQSIFDSLSKVTDTCVDKDREEINESKEDECGKEVSDQVPSKDSDGTVPFSDGKKCIETDDLSPIFSTTSKKPTSDTVSKDSVVERSVAQTSQDLSLGDKEDGISKFPDENLDSSTDTCLSPENKSSAKKSNMSSRRTDAGSRKSESSALETETAADNSSAESVEELESTKVETKSSSSKPQNRAIKSRSSPRSSKHTRAEADSIDTSPADEMEAPNDDTDEFKDSQNESEFSTSKLKQSPIKPRTSPRKSKGSHSEYESVSHMPEDSAEENRNSKTPNKPNTTSRKYDDETEATEDKIEAKTTHSKSKSSTSKSEMRVSECEMSDQEAEAIGDESDKTDHILKATTRYQSASSTEKSTSKLETSDDGAEVTADKSESLSETCEDKIEAKPTRSKSKSSQENAAVPEVESSDTENNVSKEKSDTSESNNESNNESKSSHAKSTLTDGKPKSCNDELETSDDKPEDIVAGNSKHSQENKESITDGVEATLGNIQSPDTEADHNLNTFDTAKSEFVTPSVSLSQRKTQSNNSDKNIFSSITGQSVNQKSSEDSGFEEQQADRTLSTVASITSENQDGKTSDLNSSPSINSATPTKARNLFEDCPSLNSATPTKARDLFEDCIQDRSVVDSVRSSENSSSSEVINLCDSSYKESDVSKKKIKEDSSRDFDKHKSVSNDKNLPIVKLSRCSDVSPVKVYSDLVVEQNFIGFSPLSPKISRKKLSSKLSKEKPGPKSSKLSSTEEVLDSSGKNDSSPTRYPKRGAQSTTPLKSATRKIPTGKPGPKSSKLSSTEVVLDSSDENDSSPTRYPKRGAQSTTPLKSATRKIPTGKPGPKSSKLSSTEVVLDSSDENDSSPTRYPKRGALSTTPLKSATRKIPSAKAGPKSSKLSSTEVLSDSCDSDRSRSPLKSGAQSKSLVKRKLGAAGSWSSESSAKSSLSASVNSNKRTVSKYPSRGAKSTPENPQPKNEKKLPRPKSDKRPNVESSCEVSDDDSERKFSPPKKRKLEQCFDDTDNSDNESEIEDRGGSKKRPKIKYSGKSKQDSSINSISAASDKSTGSIQEEKKTRKSDRKSLSDEGLSDSSDENEHTIPKRNSSRSSKAKSKVLEDSKRTDRKGRRRTASVSSCSVVSENSVERTQNFQRKKSKQRKIEKPGPRSSKRLSEEVMSVSSEVHSCSSSDISVRKLERVQKDQTRKGKQKKNIKPGPKCSKNLSEEVISVSSDESEDNVRKQYLRRSSKLDYSTSNLTSKNVEKASEKKRKRSASVELCSDASEKSEDWVRTNFLSKDNMNKSEPSGKLKTTGNRKRSEVESGSETSEKSEEWVRRHYPIRSSSLKSPAESGSRPSQKLGPKKNKQVHIDIEKNTVSSNDSVRVPTVLKDQKWSSLPLRVSGRNHSKDLPQLVDDPCTCFLWDQNMILPDDYNRSSFPTVRLCGISVKECSTCGQKLGKRTKLKGPLAHARNVRKSTRSQPKEEEVMFTESEGSDDGYSTGPHKTTSKIREGLTNEKFDTREWLQSLLVNVDDRDSSPSPTPETSRQTRSNLSWTLTKPEVPMKTKPAKPVKDKPRCSPRFSLSDAQSETICHKSRLREKVDRKRSETNIIPKRISKSKRHSPTEEKLEMLLKTSVDLVSRHASHLHKEEHLKDSVAIVYLCDVERHGRKPCTAALKKRGKKDRRPSAEILSKSLTTETLFTDSEDDSNDGHVIIDVVLSEGDEEDEDDGKSSFLCDLCAFTTSSRKEFQEHCKSCEFTPSSPSKQKPGEKNLKESASQVEKKKSISTDPFGKCVDFDESREKKIVNSGDPVKVQTNVKNKPKGRVARLLEGVTEVQKDESFLRCHVCSHQFDTERTLMTHMTKQHWSGTDGKRVQDPVEGFQTVKQMLTQQSAVRRYSCEKCGEAFRSENEQNDHWSKCSIQVEILSEFSEQNVEIGRMRQELDLLKEKEAALKRNIDTRQQQLQQYSLNPSLLSAVDKLSKQVSAGVAAGVLSVFPTILPQQQQQRQEEKSNFQADSSSSFSYQNPGTKQTAPFPTGLFARIDRAPIPPPPIEVSIQQCLVCGKIFTDKSFLKKHILRRNHVINKQTDEAISSEVEVLPQQDEEKVRQNMLQERQLLRDEQQRYLDLQFQRSKQQKQLEQQERLELSKQHETLRQEALSNKKETQEKERQIQVDYLKERQKEIEEEKQKAIKDQELKERSRQITKEKEDVLTIIEISENDSEGADDPQTERSANDKPAKKRGSKGRERPAIKALAAKLRNKQKRADKDANKASNQEDEVDPKDLWECRMCSKFFLTQGYLLKHTASKHPEELKKNTRQKSGSRHVPSAIVFNPKASRKPSQGRAKTHKSNKTVSAKDGEKVAKGSGNLTSFMSSISFSDSPDVVLECTHCELTFNNAVLLNQHLSQDHM